MGARAAPPGMDAMTVLDTDVFIDHFGGLEAATLYIQSIEVDQRATTDKRPLRNTYNNSA
jgi:hypothetical protein